MILKWIDAIFVEANEIKSKFGVFLLLKNWIEVHLIEQTEQFSLISITPKIWEALSNESWL
ncbi:hypothetical protein GCM10008967_37530 [Bacillus carboniphilus]|uniref:Uncharacterized protein n=1 Tax=Bacillus carboniphilus TaxID=86663 RepID=A0ABP3GFM7_9BACI